MFNSNLFAQKLAAVTPYAVDTGKYALRLDANESCFSLSDEMLEGFGERLRSVDFNRYPDPSAADLCKTFAAYYGIDAQNVCAGNGSDEILSLLMNAFADKGDAVLTFSPDFSMYAFYAALAELRILSAPKTANLQVDFDAAAALLQKERVRLCVFSNPCNPTGRIERKSAIAALAARFPDTLFVVDEAYMDFAGDLRQSESFIRDVTEYPNIIVLKTLSKAIGSAALRLGFVVADPAFCEKFRAVKSPYNVNSVSQVFGTMLLEKKSLLRERTAYITRATVLFRNALVDAGFVNIPEMYTNFVYFRTPLAQNLYEYFKQNGVLVRLFAAQSALRITSGTVAQNETVISLLAKSGLSDKQ